MNPNKKLFKQTPAQGRTVGKIDFSAEASASFIELS